MKKIAGRVFLVLSVLLGVYLICCAGHPAAYMQYVIDESEYDRIITDRIEDLSLLERIEFNEQTLFYDKSSSTFYSFTGLIPRCLQRSERRS